MNKMSVYQQQELKLATNQQLEETKRQIENQGRIVASACDACHTRMLINARRTDCGLPSCITRQTAFALAGCGYGCRVCTAPDGSLVAVLAETYGELWCWVLVYYGETDFMLLQIPKDCCDPGYEVFDTIPVSELCARLE